MNLPKGKLNLAKLEQLVFRHLPLVKDSRRVALDFASVRIQDQLVVASDPVIGIPLHYYGFFAVHYPAADVAMAGATPKFLSLGVYYPPETLETWLDETMRQLGQEARRLDLQILGGHTGGYDGLKTPFISATCLGILPKDYSQPRQVKAGDVLIAIGPIGRETLWFLANVEPSKVDAVLQPTVRRKIAADLEAFAVAPFMRHLSRKHVLLVHDLAEGGLATGLVELTKATELGIEIKYEAVPWDEAAIEVFSHLRWNPLPSSSFGSLLLVAEENTSEQMLRDLRKLGRPAAVIGEFTRDKQVLIERDGKIRPLKEGTDPYQRLSLYSS